MTSAVRQTVKLRGRSQPTASESGKDLAETSSRAARTQETPGGSNGENRSEPRGV